MKSVSSSKKISVTNEVAWFTVFKDLVVFLGECLRSKGGLGMVATRLTERSRVLNEDSYVCCYVFDGLSTFEKHNRELCKLHSFLYIE